MSRDHYLKLLPVITAYAEGKEIQFKRNGYAFENYTAHDPDFSVTDTEWRIKPKTQMYRVAFYIDKTTCTCDRFESQGDYENATDFVRWLTEWIEYEV
jgi:hypothetical protein